MITKLTPEQEAQIPQHIKKWVDLASQPIDRKKIKGILKQVFKEEKIFIIGESLQNTIDLIKVATNGKKLKFAHLNSQLDSQLYSQLLSQLDSQLYSQLRSQLNFQLYSQLDSQLYSQLLSQLDFQLDSQLRSQIDSQLDSQLYSQLDSQLDSQLYSQLRSQLDSQLRSQLDSQLLSQLDFQLDSQLDSQLRFQLDFQLDSQLDVKYNIYISYYLQNLLGYYDYVKTIGVKFNEKKLKAFNDIILNIPICVFVGNVVFICEKPQCSWLEGKLHSEKEPAIKWKDGTGIYFLNGINFDKELWEKIVNKTISAKHNL